MDVMCFMIEPSGYVETSLQCYTWASEFPCPNKKNGHSASRVVSRDVAPPDMYWVAEFAKESPYLDSFDLWPMYCSACNEPFDAQNVHKSVYLSRLFVRKDTGEEFLLQDAPVGAMWYAPWYDKTWTPQLEHVLCVKLPDGTDWTVDSQANNCTIADDRHQERHHCWTIQGEPPLITAGKSGPTCAAGAGSIMTHGYHGFLINGVLQSC